MGRRREEYHASLNYALLACHMYPTIYMLSHPMEGGGGRRRHGGYVASAELFRTV